MKLLAVETATEACSAALYLDGEVIERYQVSPRDHAQLILPMIDGLMSEAGLKLSELDALAFGRGPGSFTGVRIATGVIHGIALGGDLPVVPVSTLAAVAQEFFDRNAEGPDTAFTAMDARMGEIYFAVYQRGASGFAELLGEEKVTPAEAITFPDLTGAGIGTGWGVYREALTQRLAGRIGLIETDNLPRAAAVARLGARGYALGQAVDVEDAQPVYLRNKVAKKESER
ncbi:tRNA (adenosine(37)-N6)-threonylcarbamoyltransferase complex dimerization subunit type 1 TsaB [Methylomicrobium lacus]|uniref:tRNA (adenosine(37)-N6)-threonylcarbamoyltransferase complex dimerization subunit type 1 TsaB n=1 Tax=Methylomicrobium lacus TaxID=136992 RepID=UPI00045E867F|nr:tRNA (adenosine(37)-N6)-threonylcarbamoyltransferase complex dimerization subunit type 1 TsaB [Methylomicrobium lacus]